MAVKRARKAAKKPVAKKKAETLLSRVDEYFE